MRLVEGAHPFFLSRIADAVGGPSHSVKLHCTLPTCYTDPVMGRDLHDIQDLRRRSLDVVHELTGSLRSSGINASYQLSPCHSPLALVFMLPQSRATDNARACKATQSMQDLMKNAQSDKLYLTTVSGVPSLVIT
ncbi:fatty acid elongase [Ceratobasidium sp. AG-Ba]|nr:fatty acid elongase [Ceratobasidium sp. AG-Ba]